MSAPIPSATNHLTAMADSTARQPLSPLVRRALRCVAGVGLFGAAVAIAVAGPTAAAGVACGSCLATGNLWAFGRLGPGLVADGGARAAWVALALAKTGLLFGGVLLLLVLRLVGPLELAAGYLALPLGIALSVVFRDGRLDNGQKSE